MFSPIVPTRYRYRRPNEFTPDNSLRLSFKRRNAGRTTVEFSIKNGFLIRTFGRSEHANYMRIRAIFCGPTDSSHNIPIAVLCVRMCHTAPLFSSIITSIKKKKKTATLFYAVICESGNRYVYPILVLSHKTEPKTSITMNYYCLCYTLTRVTGTRVKFRRISHNLRPVSRFQGASTLRNNAVRA